MSEHSLDAPLYIQDTSKPSSIHDSLGPIDYLPTLFVDPSAYIDDMRVQLALADQKAQQEDLSPDDAQELARIKQVAEQLLAEDRQIDSRTVMTKVIILADEQVAVAGVSFVDRRHPVFPNPQGSLYMILRVHLNRMRMISDQQLRALVAHELGHLHLSGSFLTIRPAYKILAADFVLLVLLWAAITLSAIALGATCVSALMGAGGVSELLLLSLAGILSAPGLAVLRTHASGARRGAAYHEEEFACDAYAVARAGKEATASMLRLVCSPNSADYGLRLRSRIWLLNRLNSDRHPSLGRRLRHIRRMA